MADSTVTRAAIASAKEHLHVSRQKFATLFSQGTPSFQLANLITSDIDALVLGLLRDSPKLAEMSALLEKDVAIVAHGGYGRRDCAPYSDLDIMLLFRPEQETAVRDFGRQLFNDLYDTGVKVGPSLRTARQAVEDSLSDARIVTSLAEHRLVHGAEPLYNEFAQRLVSRVRTRRRKLIRDIFKAREDERKQFGDTVYLLEPNVKRSPGTLRDLHFIRWLSFVRYDARDWDGAELAGGLTRGDRNILREAYAFLLQLRQELHLHSGRAQDGLDRHEQVRIAKARGYVDDTARLAVERFMQEYFSHTRHVARIARDFHQTCQYRPRVTQLATYVSGRYVERDVIVGSGGLMVTSAGWRRIKRLPELIHIAELACGYDAKIETGAWTTMRAKAASLPKHDPNAELDAETAQRFMSMLRSGPRVPEVLTALHEINLLERVIPEFGEARCLLEFNEYHKYTVDEHTLQTVREFTNFSKDKGVLGKAYHAARDPGLIVLALLLHDLGKGQTRDHSEVGAEIASRTARRLRLTAEEEKILVFLVLKHLKLAHLAFWRDIQDEQLLVNFAVEVGSPELLRMLYLLTAADVAGVGPGMLNEWKEGLLTDAYGRAMVHLAGDGVPSDATPEVDQRREAAAAILEKGPDAVWRLRQLAALPRDVFQGTQAESAVDLLTAMRGISKREAKAWARAIPARRTVEYSVASYEGIAPGIFHRLTGVLASQRLEVLAANIKTLEDGLFLDRFEVHDPDQDGWNPPSPRTDAICAELKNCLENPDFSGPRFPKLWGQSDGDSGFAKLPTRVLTDNSSSAKYTIIDVFAHDRRGLLYTIAHTLWELDLPVWAAKIGTHLDQVVDVFYVTDRQGAKITSERRLEEIRATLFQRVAALDEVAQA